MWDLRVVLLCALCLGLTYSSRFVVINEDVNVGQSKDIHIVRVPLSWSGDEAECGNSTHWICEAGTFPVKTFACSDGVGNWSDGIRDFHDPIPFGHTLVAVNMTFSGRFYCDIAQKPATFIASINEMLISWYQLPDFPIGCNCSNCMTNATFASKVSDFTGYNYGDWNTFELDVLDDLCLSTVELVLIYQPVVPKLKGINPVTGPVKTHTVVNITGTGFVNTSLSYCSFNGTQVPATFLSTTLLTCETPLFEHADTVVVQASNDGVHFSQGQVTFTFTGQNKPTFLDSVEKYWWVLLIIAAIIVLISVFTVICFACRRGNNTRSSLGYFPINADDVNAPLIAPIRSLQNSSYGSLKDDINFKEIQLAERIGRGNFGEVFKGYWRGTVVAVKKTKLPAQATPAEQAEFLMDFEHEAEIMRKLRHPNVLQFLGICKLDNSEICIMTEFMPKGNLNRILHDKSIDVPWRLRLRVAVDVSRGMNYLHKSDPIIIHRDLKSYNLLVDESFKVKVCDFGLAKLLENQQGSGVMTSCGTPAWTAPEVLRNERYTEKADVYSFGIVLWELVTREEPHQGMPPFQVVFAVGTQGIRPVLSSSCPREFASLIEECWAEHPDERPAFDEIMKRLEVMDPKTWL